MNAIPTPANTPCHLGWRYSLGRNRLTIIATAFAEEVRAVSMQNGGS
ncbi:hypothetical protein ALO58_200191 [Pseudomonas savastanoi pv. savastanoi]|nr:hypothetical protein ALO58_200191 [Pseudomonas savastanoi pv. savastanoi]